MNFRNYRGFTVFELLLVAALAAVLLSASIPMVRRSMSSNQLRSSAVQLASELNMARTIAVSRNAMYQLTFSDRAGEFQIVEPLSEIGIVRRLPACHRLSTARSRDLHLITMCVRRPRLPQKRRPPVTSKISEVGSGT